VVLKWLMRTARPAGRPASAISNHDPQLDRSGHTRNTTMDSTSEQPQSTPAVELMRLLASIEAQAGRTNDLLYAMLNREQRQAFDAASVRAQN
jgi:hypothetical protein